ncbi:Ferrichrome-iron receptor [Planctomycetales bacterium 10988]|nr:Ferrichrome-iron receptor [Planctomycetales bacterium 10988]
MKVFNIQPIAGCLLCCAVFGSQCFFPSHAEAQSRRSESIQTPAPPERPASVFHTIAQEEEASQPETNEDGELMLPPTVVEEERTGTEEEQPPQEESFDTPQPPPPTPTPQSQAGESGLGLFNDYQYSVESAPFGTKTDIPISETPFSIQVVPQAVIRDQAAQRLDDVYLNVSGVAEAGNTLNAQSEVLPIIRGFESPVFFRNGMRATSVGSVELLNIESVEILKGPASILYGALQPGGVLNYTTKKPVEGYFYEFNQQIGSFDRFRTTFDINEPVSEDQTLLFRLNGAYTSSNSFRDVIDLERTGIAPSILWRPNKDTELLVDFSWSREWVPYDSGVPLGFNNEPLVPISTFFGDPTYAGRDLEDFFFSTLLTHEFSDQLTSRTQFLFHQVNAKNEAIRHRGLRGTVGNEVIRGRYQNEDRTDEAVQVVSDIIMKFGSGDIEHTVVYGVDVLYETSDFARHRENTPNIPVSANPNFRYTPTSTAPDNFLPSEQFWLGTYLQDQITFADDWHLLIGGRFDYVENSSAVDGVSRPNSYDSDFTGRIGLLYDLTDTISPYVSISQSFVPPFSGAVDQTGNQLAPETGLQYEAGIKMESYDKKLLATAAVYRIEKEDVALFDQNFFNNTGNIAYIPGVNQRSQGFEFDLLGELNDVMNIIGNYAYTDTATTQNLVDPTVVGNRLGNAPLHISRVWLTYNSPKGSTMEGFGFGGGPRYQSHSLAEFDTSTVLGSYIYYDAGIWYRQPKKCGGPSWQYQLNFYNIFDTEYYARASTRDIVHPGTPFSVIGSIGIDY